VHPPILSKQCARARPVAPSISLGIQAHEGVRASKELHQYADFSSWRAVVQQEVAAHPTLPYVAVMHRTCIVVLAAPPLLGCRMQQGRRVDAAGLGPSTGRKRAKPAPVRVVAGKSAIR